jgi:integral membrane protein
VHGWLYVAYLFGDFRLWTMLRWGIGKFLIIALGGVVPFLSFFTERHFTKLAEGYKTNE